MGRGGLDSARQVVAVQNFAPLRSLSGKRHGEYHNDYSLHACGGSYCCRRHLRRVGTPILTENCSTTDHGGGKRRGISDTQRKMRAARPVAALALAACTFPASRGLDFRQGTPSHQVRPDQLGFTLLRVKSGRMPNPRHSGKDYV